MLILLLPILFVIILVVTIGCGTVFLGFDGKRQTGRRIPGAVLALLPGDHHGLRKYRRPPPFFDIEGFGRRYDPYFSAGAALVILDGWGAGGQYVWCVVRE